MQTVTHSFEEVFDYGLPSDPETPNAAPTRATLDVLARVAEAAFLRFLDQAAAGPEVRSASLSIFFVSWFCLGFILVFLVSGSRKLEDTRLAFLWAVVLE